MQFRKEEIEKGVSTADSGVLELIWENDFLNKTINMIREIRIPRTTVSSSTNGLRWSDDGQLALVTGASVTILSPSVIKSQEAGDVKKMDEQYDTTRTLAIEEKQHFLEGKTMANDEALSIGGASSDHVVTDVCWSPTGISLRRGCLLAALTTRNEVFIYEPKGNPGLGRWRQLYSLNNALMGDLGLDQPSLKDAEVRQLRIHSICWTRACPVKGSKWGTSFLLLGSESGGLALYRVDSLASLQFVQHSQVFDNSRWITNLEVSEWIQASEESKSRHAFVAVTTSDNAVEIRRLVYDPPTESVTWDTDNPATQVLPPSRFYSSTQSFYVDKKTDVAVLAVYRTGTLNVWKFNGGVNANGQRVFTSFSSLASGVVISGGDDQNVVRITVVSCKGEVYACEMDLHAESIVLRPIIEQAISGLVAKKRKTLDIATADAETIDFRTFGAIMHPHGNYMAIAYAVFLGKKLRYPINSEQSRRIAFLSLSHLSTPRLPSPWPITAGSSLCSWWEAKALIKAIPPVSRDEYRQSLIATMSANLPSAEQLVQGYLSQSPSDSLTTDLYEALINNLALDKIRFLDHYGEYENWPPLVVKLLAITVLKHIKQHPQLLENSTDVDRAILYSLSQHLPDAVADLRFFPDSPELIEISGGFFTQKFDFTITDSITTIPNQPSSETENPITWKRCSITFLPLMAVDCLTCTACFRKALKLNTDQLKDSALANILLDSLDACIYCGGRFYERSD